jgi:uncharacterized repeat protein (TIGR03803 family)
VQLLENTLGRQKDEWKARGSTAWWKLGTSCATFLICAAWATSAPAQTLNTLFGFHGVDGAYSDAGLVQGTDGNFYGSTVYGGSNSQGTLFKITPQGQLTTLHDFCSESPYCSDGSYPLGALVQGTDGDFYGTTATGGGSSDTWGVVFKITSSGSFTTMHSFHFADGATPRGTLVQGSDGNFYGTTYEGGVNTACVDTRACGTVFKLTPAGDFTTLYSFCSQSNCTDGASPVSGLVQDAEGNLYGTTYREGVGGAGTVFKITTSGALTTLHSFCSQSGCADGMFPSSGLVVARDGNLYGTTSQGGAGTVYAVGTIFKITPQGEFTTLYSFCSQSGCAEGGLPMATLVQGHDRNFYGATSGLGVKRAGTVFKISSSGRLTTLYTFCSHGVYPYCADGNAPIGALVQGSDGNFYGTTQGQRRTDCAHNICGTVFQFGIGLNLQPTSGAVGRTVGIVGLNLTGATKVSFRGVSTAFTVVSGTKISAIVPAGAATGPVTVITPGGALTSNTSFVVMPQIKRFTPTRGPVGTAVTILGTTFTHTTSVTFGGVKATKFTVNSDSQMTATVPPGADSGAIGLTTPAGTTTTVSIFTVTQ